jgi:hypothetical protein
VVLDGNDAGYGVIGDAQLAWFRETLGQAKAAGEKVICFCHFAALKAAAEHHRLAKPEPVLAALDNAGCVVAWIAGHDHAGGYALRKGVHHVTLRGLVEAGGATAFARFELADSRLRETGFGNEPGRELPFGAGRSGSAPPLVRERADLAGRHGRAHQRPRRRHPLPRRRLLLVRRAQDRRRGRHRGARRRARLLVPRPHELEGRGRRAEGVRRPRQRDHEGVQSWSGRR